MHLECRDFHCVAFSHYIEYDDFLWLFRSASNHIMTPLKHFEHGTEHCEVSTAVKALHSLNRLVSKHLVTAEWHKNSLKFRKLKDSLLNYSVI